MLADFISMNIYIVESCMLTPVGMAFLRETIWLLSLSLNCIKDQVYMDESVFRIIWECRRNMTMYCQTHIAAQMLHLLIKASLFCKYLNVNMPQCKWNNKLMIRLSCFHWQGKSLCIRRYLHCSWCSWQKALKWLLFRLESI